MYPMPMYPFQDLETGVETELFYAMDDAPPIGGQVTRKGRKLRRLVCSVQMAPTPDRRHTSRSLPRNWGREKINDPKGLEVDRDTGERFNWGKGYADRYDAVGRPQFDSQAEIDRAEARANNSPEADTGFKGYNK